MKAKQTIYVHKKKVYVISDRIFKNSSNFFKLSYIFPLPSKISPVTPHFCTCVKFAYTYLFDADLTDPDVSRNILSKNLRYFRNSIRSWIHLFNPRVTFTRIGRVVISLIFSDTLTRDTLKWKEIHAEGSHECHASLSLLQSRRRERKINGIINETIDSFFLISTT